MNNKSMGRIVWNPQLVAEWNQHEVLDGIHRRWHGINPKGRNIQSLRFDDIPFALQTDYILSYARYHTNPLDWIKKERSFHFVLFLSLLYEKELGKIGCFKPKTSCFFLYIQIIPQKHKKINKNLLRRIF